MGSNISGGVPGGAAPLGGGGIRGIIREEVAAYMRGGEIGVMLGAAAVNANAQSAASGVGIGIQNIRRGLIYLEGTRAGNMTVTAGAGMVSFTRPLKGSMFLSGRPLLMVAGITMTAGDPFTVGFFVRNVQIGTTRAPGCYVDSDADVVADARTPFIVVPAPTAGLADVELKGQSVGTNTTVYDDTDNALVLLAVEL